MKNVSQLVLELISRHAQGKKPLTMLAVCPNSPAVLEAAVRAAARNRSVMLFAATLNQVDFEASYTGWTQAEFVHQMNEYAQKYEWCGPLYPCLDHGGPWLKDLHTLAGLTYAETMEKVKKSITACIEAGYKLLHIDPTIDRSLPGNIELPLDLVVNRTVDLIEHAERVRITSGSAKLSYEVGTEEVHGGLVDINRFKDFLSLLRQELQEKSLADCWPCLFVAQIGTDLHTTSFKPEIARILYEILSPLGSMVKGHYTDWVRSPEDYPYTGIGAANVGPEFTAQEYIALCELEEFEQNAIDHSHVSASRFMEILQGSVIESGRWKKWLFPNEINVEFDDLPDARRDWLIKTGARYIWSNEKVVAARKALYQNIQQDFTDPHGYVVEKIAQVIEKYIQAFNLQNSIDILEI